MATQTIASKKREMADRCAGLKEYAERMLLHGENPGEDLAPGEQDDQRQLMAEFLATGRSFGLTESEMVQLVFGEIFAVRRESGCHSCSTRQFW